METLEKTERTLTDAEALDQLQRHLDNREWSPDDLDEVARLVRATGRTIRDPYAERA